MPKPELRVPKEPIAVPHAVRSEVAMCGLGVHESGGPLQVFVGLLKASDHNAVCTLSISLADAEYLRDSLTMLLQRIAEQN